eukprot:3379967-Pleurochrysis_carterae.AAC.2
MARWQRGNGTVAAGGLALVHAQHIRCWLSFSSAAKVSAVLAAWTRLVLAKAHTQHREPCA